MFGFPKGLGRLVEGTICNQPTMVFWLVFYCLFMRSHESFEHIEYPNINNTQFITISFKHYLFCTIKTQNKPSTFYMRSSKLSEKIKKQTQREIPRRPIPRRPVSFCSEEKLWPKVRMVMIVTWAADFSFGSW